jgi:hypothetical protein
MPTVDLLWELDRLSRRSVPMVVLFPLFSCVNWGLFAIFWIISTNGYFLAFVVLIPQPEMISIKSFGVEFFFFLASSSK